MNEHYYTKKPTSTFLTKKINVLIKGTTITLTTATGIFSKEKIDLGTKILIENADIKEDSTVLDLGCGYGAVGISLAKIVPGLKVVLTDANQRATKLAKENTQQNHVDADVRTGDGYKTVADEKFDYVLLNPPQTAGRALCFKLIEETPLHLHQKGEFYLVARHKKGGKMLEAKMKETFGNVQTIARESGYRVYKSTK